MILDNYWQMKYASSQYHYSTSAIMIPVSIKSYTGASITRVQTGGGGYVNNWQNALLMYSLRYNLRAKIGDGNTAPTSSDYTLDSDITSIAGGYLSVTSNTGVDNGLVTNIIISGINTSSTEQVIREIGIYINTAFEPSATTYDILIVRELLNQPLVVPAGKGFTITFQWTEA